MDFNFTSSPNDSFNVTARRNIVVDSYNTTGISTGIHSIGITTNFLIEENVVDHNGWNATLSAQGSNTLSHNLYLSATDNAPSDLTLRGNIISNDTAGTQIRPGRGVINNVCIRTPSAQTLAL